LEVTRFYCKPASQPAIRH